MRDVLRPRSAGRIEWSWFDHAKLARLDQLKFAKNANNLELTMRDQADKLVIKNWCASSANQIGEFRLNDGSKVKER